MENYFINFALGGWKFCVPSLRSIVVEIGHFLLSIFLKDPRDHSPSYLLLILHIFIGKFLQ